MSYRYALAEHGRTLATRALGAELRADLVERADGEDVVLDFSGVDCTSHSFADEFVARLAEDARTGEPRFEISIRGASEEVGRVVLKALERREISAPALA